MRRLAMLGILILTASVAQALTIEMVPVGNPGNLPDTRYPSTYNLGSVAYNYDIGKYELTAGQYTEFLNAVASVDRFGLYDIRMSSDEHGAKILRYGNSVQGYSYIVHVYAESRPVNFIDWGDAARFANWMHNGQPTGTQKRSTTENGSYRLDGATNQDDLMAIEREPDATWVIPTEDEWYKAACYDPSKPGGAGYYDYATGADLKPSNDLINPDPGNNATFYDQEYSIGFPSYRTEVGAHENSESPYGTFDQSGNVKEWTESIWNGPHRILRGGSYEGVDPACRYRSSSYPDIGYNHIGFRIAHIPEPDTAVLSALTLLALLCCRCRLP
jgi:formylglycine-generating enzyme required for sulfatase activity